MENSNGKEACIYNLLFTQYNEDFGRENYFSYDLQYPIFYNFKNPYFYVDPEILSNINSTINSDVYTFKDGLLEEEKEYNKIAPQNALPNRNYKAISNYAVTFNKNHILSTTLSLMGFTDNSGPTYNNLNNYNFDLLTGNVLTLKDIFNDGIDYIKVITDYVKYKINQNKDMYYKNVDVEITEDQPFYLTDSGLVIYFGLDQIAPAEFDIPKFRLSFNKFAPYINPRFYCSANNIFR